MYSFRGHRSRIKEHDESRACAFNNQRGFRSQSLTGDGDHLIKMVSCPGRDGRIESCHAPKLPTSVAAGEVSVTRASRRGQPAVVMCTEPFHRPPSHHPFNETQIDFGVLAQASPSHALAHGSEAGICFLRSARTLRRLPACEEVAGPPVPVNQRKVQVAPTRPRPLKHSRTAIGNDTIQSLVCCFSTASCGSVKVHSLPSPSVCVHVYVPVCLRASLSCLPHKRVRTSGGISYSRRMRSRLAGPK